MLSDSTSDVNRDSEHGTRLTSPSPKKGKKIHTRRLFHDRTGVLRHGCQQL